MPMEKYPENNYRNYSKLLFISCNHGAGGHRLGRIISCFNSVYWYSHESNGKTPFDTPDQDICKERLIANYHYDRRLSDGSIVPAIGERISLFWNNDEWLHNWNRIMNTLSLPDQYLTFVLHETPKQLREWFPNSYIINFVDDDIERSLQRHLKSSSKFRIDVKHIGQKPQYKNKHQKDIDYCLSKSINTMRELWEYQNPTKDYINNERQKMTSLNNSRIKQKSFSNHTMSWNNFNLPDLGKLNTNTDNLKQLRL